MSSFGAKGRYKLEIVNSKTGENKETPWFDNLITDIGLDKLIVGGYMTACKVGTGTGAPATTDNNLQNALAVTSTVVGTTVSVSPTSPYFTRCVRTWQFPVGAVVGNISEVGIFYSGGLSDISCCSRALIMDDSVPPAPTTISLTADDFLKVTYEGTLYYTETDVTGTVNIGGSDYDYTIRPVAVLSYANSIDYSPWGVGLCPSNLGNGVILSGAQVYSSGMVAVTAATVGYIDTADQNVLNSGGAQPYTPGDFKRSIKYLWDRPKGNKTWNSIMLAWGDRPGNPQLCVAYQVGLTPGFPKTALKEVGLTFEISVARYTP